MQSEPLDDRVRWLAVAVALVCLWLLVGMLAGDCARLERQLAALRRRTMFRVYVTQKETPADVAEV